MTRAGLTSITIENFKGISDPVKIPLRPITLLFGANSAGKSTILHALLYALEVLENRNPDVHYTRVGGEMITLGGFHNLVHKHDLSRSIKITLEYFPGIFAKEYGTWLNHKQFTVTIITAWSFPLSRAIVKSYEVGFDYHSFGRITLLDYFLKKNYPEEYGDFRQENRSIVEGRFFPALSNLVIDDSHPIFSLKTPKSPNICKPDPHAGSIVEHANPPSNFSNEDTLKKEKKELRVFKSILARCLKKYSEDFTGTHRSSGKSFSHYLVDNTIPQWAQEEINLLDFSYDAYFDKITVNTSIFNDKRRLLPDVRIVDQRKYLEEKTLLGQIMVCSGLPLLKTLQCIRYLGPFREIPKQLHVFKKKPCWANGLGAWDELLSNDKYCGEMSLVERCSNYLHNILNIGYTLRKEKRIHLPVDGKLWQHLQGIKYEYQGIAGAALGVEELKQLISECDDSNFVPEIVLQLHDENNDVDVNPTDIGVGISQVLPVVVGAVEPNCSIFAVEQPELHIHPAVQVNLADIFLRETLEPIQEKRLFLLETHSEHLVLRIMRRMRETCEGTLPETFPDVKPEHVAVLYVEVIDGRSIVREMPLNERGELVKAWPGGFFEEGLKETL